MYNFKINIIIFIISILIGFLIVSYFTNKYNKEKIIINIFIISCIIYLIINELSKIDIIQNIGKENPKQNKKENRISYENYYI